MPSFEQEILVRFPQQIRAMNLNQQQTAVLVELIAQGEHGANDYELANATGFIQDAIRPRRGELEKSGLVEVSDVKRPMHTRRTGKVSLVHPEWQDDLWAHLTSSDCSIPESTSPNPDDVGALLLRLAVLGLRLRTVLTDGMRVDGAPDPGSFAIEIWPTTCDRRDIRVRARIDDAGLHVDLTLTPGWAEDGAQVQRQRLALRERLKAIDVSHKNELDGRMADGWAAEVDQPYGSFDAWAQAAAEHLEAVASLSRVYLPSELDALGFDLIKELQPFVEAALSPFGAVDATERAALDALQDAMFWNEAQARELIDLLAVSRQVLIAGPPGTGKTMAARAVSEALVGAARVRFVQFHPTYAYEDFVEGIRPRLGDDAESLTYTVRPGVLLKLINHMLEVESETGEQPHYVLIIDEINRANVAKVLGEFLFALEYRGADNAVELSVSGESRFLPENLWVIGTMNTADRSVALFDAAMRRRFKEIRLEPDYDALRLWHASRTTEEMGIQAAERLQRLNDSVVDILDEDRAIGHSFLMRADLENVGFETVWRQDLAPVLRDHLLGRSDDLETLQAAFLGEE